jgi:hypothetical protein
MPKRKTPELKPEEQFKRFAEAAKELGVDERKAERAFKTVAAHQEQQVKKSSQK